MLVRSSKPSNAWILTFGVVQFVAHITKFVSIYIPHGVRPSLWVTKLYIAFTMFVEYINVVAPFLPFAFFLWHWCCSLCLGKEFG